MTDEEGKLLENLPIHVKEKEYEKMSVARYIHFGKNKTIVQNGV